VILILEGEEGAEGGRRVSPVEECVIWLGALESVTPSILFLLDGGHLLSCHLSSKLSSDSSLTIEFDTILSMLAMVASWYGWELCLVAVSSS